MNLHSWFRNFKTCLLISLFFLAGCSVYKSTGRKNFETKAPGNVQMASAIRSATTDPTDSLSQPLDETETMDEKTTCWNQPINDPLWQVEPNTLLTVMAVSEDEIQVCLQTE
jgi:hypothetical protein